jgi:hypothetical protein
LGGYKVTADRVAMDQKKIATVKNYPVPNKTKQMKAFFGVAGFYRKFVLRHSTIDSQLHKLTKKCHMWGRRQAEAFRTLKNV